jgi:hypothetical protein
LRRDQEAERRRLVRHEDDERKQPDQEARDAGENHRDLAPLAESLDERDRRQLRHLREKRHGRQKADVPGRGAELEREADEDHPAIERAHQARPGGVLDERRLAALDVFRRHQGIGCETHPD